MTKEENIVLNILLDHILDGCRSCIIDCYEEDDERLKKLKARVQYEMVEKNAKMTDKEFDGLLFEVLDFLNSGYRFSETYDNCMMAKLIDDLFNDPVFQKYNKIYEEEGKIDRKLLIELAKKHKKLLDHLKIAYMMDKNDLISTKYSDDDLSYLSVYYDSRKEQLEEVFKVLEVYNE